ncbi:sensor histidine kinase [Profundibacter sp.]|uniref:sensor histidine kinase n=1 Tax=Profundibacter sp. TaxID=3101071 RepID=UPI003D109176
MTRTTEPISRPTILSEHLRGLATGERGEEVWIDVIRQMDRVYSELVESQVALEAKNAELESAQEFIASVMRAMSDLMIVCDTDGQIVQVNEALIRLTGLDPGDLEGRALAEVLHAPDQDADDTFVVHLRARRAFSDCEVAIRAANGEEVPLSVNCSPRHDRRGRPAGLVLIGRPMGELQRAYRKLDAALKQFERAQQQLIASEKMAALGRLVAGVAHELNNPISFIYGNIHALQKYQARLETYLKAVEDGASAQTLAEMREALGIGRIIDDMPGLIEGTLEGAERVSSIVQDLRRFSGNQREPNETFAIESAMRTALSWVKRGGGTIPEISVACEAGLVVTTRRGHVHQILVNLVQNAFDALAGTGRARIELSERARDGRVQITVCDNGPGIASEAADRIFEPFFTTKPVGHGTGLGLYLSYRMAEELGARLSHSSSEAGGACFTLDLPAVPPEVAP